ncbi:MAG: rod shape-determining protein MreD [Thomasclavelia sp.]|nr:rod shape-determining protein MreD [Thomasclavelia sp.]
MNRKTIIFLIIMFGAFCVDNLLGYFLPYNFSYQSITLIPYVSLIMFVFLSNKVNPSERYLFSIICGLYYAVIYTNSLYVFVIVYCIYAFGVERYANKSTLSFFEGLLTCGVIVLINETILYVISCIFGMNSMNILLFVGLRLIPTIIMNLVLYIPCYFINTKIQSSNDDFILDY